MRVIKKIEIEGKEVEALFDTGAFHTWVIKEYLRGATRWDILYPYRVALGGKEIEVREEYHVNGKIEGLGFDTNAIPIDEIGKINGHKVEAIIGAGTMERWEISVKPKDGALDLSGLRRRTFTEFFE